MRRFRQQLSTDKVTEILNAGTNGVLSLTGIDGEPYGVPVSYAYDGDGHIYFHSALVGHKIECIKANARCSFCVVAQDCIVPEEFTTYFRSVIVSGRIEILSDAGQIHYGLMELCRKYSPGVDSAAEISRCIRHVAVMRMDIDDITGKESIELVRRE